MIQSPIPTPDSVAVPLPDAFEQWRDLYIHGAGQKLLAFLAIAVLLYLLSRVARRQITIHIEDINRRHAMRKWVAYSYAFLLVVFGVALFAESLTGLGAVVALLLAGLAVALQDVLKSAVGWVYLSSRRGIEVGSRVELNGVMGDVIDVGVLKTTLLEVGGALVYGRQSTGRLVTVPNYRLLSDTVLLSAAGSPFVWQEIRITVTYESDWQRAEAILREIADEIHAEIAPSLAAGFRNLERRYAFKYGTLTPIVYVSLGASGVELTLRYLIHVRRRRGSVDRVSRRLLAAFAAENGVELAYPTYRMFRLGEDEDRPHRPPVPPEQGRMEGEDAGLPPPDLLAE